MKKIFTLFFLMTTLFAAAQQTADTMYVYKGGNIVERIPVSGIDSVTFALPVVPDTPVTPPAETQYEAVDLGLSVKWASCNVGATKPEDRGDYYAWGEIEAKDYYDWSTYKWCNGSDLALTKYCTINYYGAVDNKILLDPDDDVAHVKWGGSWRMPTLDELLELLNNCTWSWTTQNGVNGCKVTGPNGNSIFLPAAGYRMYERRNYSNAGSYWANSLSSHDVRGAEDLWFSEYRCQVGMDPYTETYPAFRHFGRSVRPVCD